MTAMPQTLSPRDRLLASAQELFYAEGVHSVGIDRILEHAGVAKASLYTHFGSKEELARAYLEQRHVRLLSRLRRAVEGRTDPRERILAVFDSQADSIAAPGFRGCAFAAASAEAPAGGLIEAEVASSRSDIRALFVELAAAYGARDPALLAAQLHLLYDGTSTSANLDHDPSIARATRAAVERLLS
jgi:AcrR family transcriptional regulator